MKKFFKLFAVALVAGCMFTACGEKENNDDNGGNNGGNTGKNEITVTWGSETYKAGAFEAVSQYASQYGILYDYIYKTAGVDENLVWGWAPATVGTFGIDDNDNVYLGFMYDDGQEGYTDEAGDFGDPGTTYARWQSEDNLTFNITAVDLNAKTVSGTYVGACYDLVEQLMNDADVVKDLKVTFDGAVWTAVQ